MSMEEQIVMLGPIIKTLQEQELPSTWKEQMTLVRTDLSEMLLEVMLNRPYAPVVSPEDDVTIQDMLAEITNALMKFEENLNKKPLSNPDAMEGMRMAGDAVRPKVKALRRIYRRVYPGERQSLKPDPLAELPQNRLGVHPDCEVGYKLNHIIHAAGTQEAVPFTAHNSSKVEYVYACKTQATYDMHTFSAIL
mmetsp:Transcript_133641/g.249992  ORF Transcript_133641/g.249992 Transcript_133641/m.249992 type:complete len:193 (-) Transcript_133641:87-665(-)